MQKQEEQAPVYLQLDQTQQQEAQHLTPERRLLRFPFSRTVKSLLQSFVNVNKLKRELATSDWILSKGRFDLILRESAEWELCYLPVSVKDKVVLDVGAGEGETAKFFLDHGARRVICIESDSAAFTFLHRNAGEHGFTAIQKRFDLTDLKEFNFDFLKIDVEGYEEVLLDTVLRTPAVLEVHGFQLREKFAQRGYRIDKRSRGCTCYAYWMC